MGAGAIRQGSFGARARLFAAACAVALVAGCAQPGVPGSENRAETVGTGAVVGAALGAIIGGLAGGGRGAAIGAGAGALLGAGAGVAVQAGNERAAMNEQVLRERAALAREQAAAYEADSRATMRDIASLQREVNTLNAQYRSGRMNAAQYEQRVSEVQTRAVTITQRTENGSAAIENLRKDAEAGRRGGMDTQEIDNSLHTWSEANARERAALDDLQRSLAQGRG